ncbi:DUF1971 domain-containing protein [Pseudoduganella sp. FT26W]|uniref:DUF1971 domain-containing protein n=1 Tax=Duganella aquatilis TaxID=2666082 RepID=A0A844D821_9BURK|nr:DUF1971 domain-containing protein [Duganella aquatilis]MRW83004.1 DUF1971 domain-containing protein [Duganella aquatilis]
MKTIPDTVTHYKSTTVFTQDTVPAAIQRGHTTAGDVWARIRILEGSLLYRITDPRVLAEEVLLTPDLPGVVEPQIEHEVQVVGPVRFQLDFHR